MDECVNERVYGKTKEARGEEMTMDAKPCLMNSKSKRYLFKSNTPFPRRLRYLEGRSHSVHERLPLQLEVPGNQRATRLRLAFARWSVDVLNRLIFLVCVRINSLKMTENRITRMIIKERENVFFNSSWMLSFCFE